MGLEGNRIAVTGATSGIESAADRRRWSTPARSCS